MARGEHFFAWYSFRGIPFQHHGIDLGDGRAVHFCGAAGMAAGPQSDRESLAICVTKIGCITASGRRLHWVNHDDAFDPDKVCRRAERLLGRAGYHLAFDNCEHFATWCATGRHESDQVSVAARRSAAATAKLVAAAAARLATRRLPATVLRGVQPQTLVADAVQFAAEAGGHHAGLSNPRQRRIAGRFLGSATAVGIGALAGPMGAAVAATTWVAGECIGAGVGRAIRR